MNKLIKSIYKQDKSSRLDSLLNDQKCYSKKSGPLSLLKKHLKSKKKIDKQRSRIFAIKQFYDIQETRKKERLKEEQEKFEQEQRKKKKKNALLMQLQDMKEKLQKSKKMEIIEKGKQTKRNFIFQKRIVYLKKETKKEKNEYEIQVPHQHVNTYIRTTIKKLLPFVNKYGNQFLDCLKERVEINSKFFSFFFKKQSQVYNYYSYFLKKIKKKKNKLTNGFYSKFKILKSNIIKSKK